MLAWYLSQSCVCLSQVGVLLKRLNVSHRQRHTIARRLSIFLTAKLKRGHIQRRRQMQVGWTKTGDFRRITCYSIYIGRLTRKRRSPQALSTEARYALPVNKNLRPLCRGYGHMYGCQKCTRIYEPYIGLRVVRERLPLFAARFPWRSASRGFVSWCLQFLPVYYLNKVLCLLQDIFRPCSVSTVRVIRWVVCASVRVTLIYCLYCG